jgi:hypothetical protein
MRISSRLVPILIGAAGLLVPLLGLPAEPAMANAAAQAPDCIVTSTPAQVGTGEGATGSSIADFIAVECKPVFAEQKVEISSPQLSNRCQGKLSWFSDSNRRRFASGQNFNVVLDDDGYAGAVVWGGPSCAAGKSLITATLKVAPYTLATTHFTILSPKSTPEGIAAAPAVETEDSTSSGAATVFNIEFPAGYAEQKVQISSPQLYGQCQDHLTWVGADEAILGSGNSVSTTLDDNGNAFVVVLAGPSCTTGTSEVTAKLLAGPQPTVQTSFKILSPSPAA